MLVSLALKLCVAVPILVGLPLLVTAVVAARLGPTPFRIKQFGVRLALRLLITSLGDSVPSRSS